MSFGQFSQSLVLFAFFFDHAAGYEVLEFFVCPEAEHFFSATDGVAFLEPCVNSFE